MKPGLPLGGLLVAFSMVMLSSPLPNCLTANPPLSGFVHSPCSTSTSCLPPLTHTTAETPKQLEPMTLVSKEIECPLCLTPASQTHAHTYKLHTCPCSHTRIFWHLLTVYVKDHSRKAVRVRRDWDKADAHKCTHGLLGGYTDTTHRTKARSDTFTRAAMWAHHCADMVLN